jgi:hypothetical protein
MITRFVIVSFGDEYLKYKKALVRSINDNCIDFEIVDIELKPLKRKDFHLANYLKLQTWAKNIKGNTVLIDADTIVLGNVSEVFDLDSDLIYTKRQFNRSIPFNSGVVFVKESGIPIIQKWAEIDHKMYKNPFLHRKYKGKYYGFNQSSFGCLLETHSEFKIDFVCCSIYNSCDAGDWKVNYNFAKIVHVKSDLRISVNKKRGLYKDIEKRILKYYS